jgi:hypothetical protein
MNVIEARSPGFNDVTLLKLAREIATDLRPIEEVLSTFKIGPEEWETLQKHPHFQGVLRSSIEEWNSATNTSERLRLKSLAFVEEALPEFYARAHDPTEPLSAKIEVLKSVARFAGVGAAGTDSLSASERLSVTINLGADQQLRIEKDVTPRVIEGEAL